ncbi:hypothetical protein [Qipengyuania huizhouensis]|uniref:hypothetical protein n=1 Tax=Qipengyuania huizhouensis TaxID=2867245 RepID=UPI001FFD26CD|nr:hypothetical protein [Qipengyuania huizhouensis]
MDQTGFIDYDHSIRHRIQDRTQVCLTSCKFSRSRFGFEPRALKPFPADRDREADHHEGNGSDDASAFDWTAQTIAYESRRRTRDRGECAGPKSGQSAGNDDAWNKENKGGALPKLVRKSKTKNYRKTDSQQRSENSTCERKPRKKAAYEALPTHLREIP